MGVILTNQPISTTTISQAPAPINSETFVSSLGAAATSGSSPLGVTAYKAASTGDELAVYTSGIVRVLAGEAVTAGDEIQPDDNGQAIPLNSGNDRAGLAISNAATSNTVIIARIPY